MSTEETQKDYVTCQSCGRIAEVPKWQKDNIAVYTCHPCVFMCAPHTENGLRLVRLRKAVDAVISVGHKQSIIAMLKELEPEDWE